MIQWQLLECNAQVYQVERDSQQIPILIYKHSPRCDLSSLTKQLLEQQWDYPITAIRPYLLNVLQHKEVSNLVSEVFQEHHQSPQLLFIQQGVCTYAADYPDITIEEFKDCIVL